MTILFVVLGIIVLLVIVFIGIFNGLVRMRNEVKNSWAQIDVQLKRRYDLIPNLVEAVKGYVKHERETLESVTKARNLAQQLSTSENVGARGKAEGELSSALMRLLAVAESYPDLKANQNFLALQEELSSTENKISFSRQYYNDSVLKLNNQVQMFPSSVVASMANFHAGEFFEVTVAAEKEAPKVKFS
jgi:LemA protein